MRRNDRWQPQPPRELRDNAYTTRDCVADSLGMAFVFAALAAACAILGAL